MKDPAIKIEIEVGHPDVVLYGLDFNGVPRYRVQASIHYGKVTDHFSGMGLDSAYTWVDQRLVQIAQDLVTESVQTPLEPKA